MVIDQKRAHFTAKKISRWKLRGRLFTGTYKGKSPNPANIHATKSERAMPQTLAAETD